MKILVVYASAGAGHRKAAEAVYNYLKEHYKGLDLTIIDALKKTNLFFSSSYNWGYNLLINRAIFIWRLFFWLTDFRYLRPITRRIATFVNWVNTRKFLKFLIQENPDFIISTHFLPSEIICLLKNRQKIKSKLITVITDFGVHPYWISKGTDIYVVASGLTKERLIREGIAQDAIKVFGIPVEAKFSRKLDKTELCKKLDLDENKFTVMLMTGSFGIGPLEEITEALHKEAQVLVVCAKNKKVYEKLKNKNLSNVRVFGFIDNVEELMAVSDLIITKPGGLTISELLNMELFPLFVSRIPGQESANVEVLAKYGVGLYAESIEEIKNIALDLKDHPQKLQDLKEDIRKIKKPFASREICNVVCEGSIGVTG